MVVAGHDQHAAGAGGAGVVAVAEGVTGAIHAGALAVPDREDAIDLGALEQVDLLAAPDGSRGHVLVDARLEADVVALEKALGLPELLVVAAERRAPVSGDEAAGVEAGGVIAILGELDRAGLLNGDVMTCTGETLAAQVQRLGGKRADGKVVHAVDKPYKPTGGLRVLGGNLSPDFSAILKLAGVEGGLENNTFRGKARVFEGEQALRRGLDDGEIVPFFQPEIDAATGVKYTCK